jgi:hypothetical protein
MEAVSTSETYVNFYQTVRRNVPEDNALEYHKYCHNRLKPKSVFEYLNIQALPQRKCHP